MEPTQLVNLALELVGAASVIAAFLRNILPYLRTWSQRTAMTADDAAVEAASIVLSLFTMGIELAHKVAHAAGLNPMPATKDDDGSDDDEPKGEVFL